MCKPEADIILAKYISTEERSTKHEGLQARICPPRHKKSKENNKRQTEEERNDNIM